MSITRSWPAPLCALSLSLSLLVPAKSYTVDVVPVAGRGTILAPVKLTLPPGTLTRVFAVGDPSSGTADAVVQVLRVGVTGSGVPSSVPTGGSTRSRTTPTSCGTSFPWWRRKACPASSSIRRPWTG